MKTCETCNKEHDGKYSSGRFCSRGCSNTRTRSEETKKKIAETLKNRELGHPKLLEKVCLNCNNIFIIDWGHRDNIYCNNAGFLTFFYNKDMNHKYYRNLSVSPPSDTRLKE